MVTIELTQRSHFDLIELITTFKHEYWNYIESYESYLRENPKDQYVNDEKTKALYVLCTTRLEVCDRVIKELKQEPVTLKNKKEKNNGNISE